jgi:hypothetical protein
MAQQKSEDRIVPQGRRKSAPTGGFERRRGGRAVPVKGEDLQLMLSFMAAENPREKRGAEGGDNSDLSELKARKVAKVKAKQRRVFRESGRGSGVPR